MIISWVRLAYPQAVTYENTYRTLRTTYSVCSRASTFVPRLQMTAWDRMMAAYTPLGIMSARYYHLSVQAIMWNFADTSGGRAKDEDEVEILNIYIQSLSICWDEGLVGADAGCSHELNCASSIDGGYGSD